MIEVGDVVVVLASAYALFVLAVVAAARRPVARPRRGAGAPDAPPRGYLASTVAGGYLAFLLIVLVFHVWLVGEGDALGSALGGGAFLGTVAAAAFAGLSWAEGRLRR